ncbi:hypothetical protein ACF1BX_36010, partial [Streptomyces globisporus]
IPTKVLRNLYIYSGNQCAFPGCSHKIVDDDGNYIAQLCHIESANIGGERFNPEMTNKQRADYPNLLLLCYEHHQVTNNVQKYPVDVMKALKAKHEAKFKNILEDISNTFIPDITKGQKLSLPKTLIEMNKYMGWRHNEDELKGTIEFIERGALRLKKLPPGTRSVFLTMLERSENNEILLDEVQQVLSIPNEEWRKHYDMLVKYELISVAEEHYELLGYYSTFCEEEGWPMWQELKTYCKGTERDLDEVIENLRFDLLD